MSASKPPKRKSKPKLGPNADRLVIQPEALGPGLDRLLGKGQPASDPKTKAPKSRRKRSD